MQKVGIFLMCFLAALIFGAAGAISGQESGDKMLVPLGTIVLGAPDGVEAKRAAVDFPHGRHFGFQCQTCHHKWEGTEQIKNCMTSGCHDVLVSPTKSQPGKSDRSLAISYFKKAYHEQCIGCHRIMRLKNKKIEMSRQKLEEPLPPTGPTGCVECHPREQSDDDSN